MFGVSIITGVQKLLALFYLHKLLVLHSSFKTSPSPTTKNLSFKKTSLSITLRKLLWRVFSQTTLGAITILTNHLPQRESYILRFPSSWAPAWYGQMGVEQILSCSYAKTVTIHYKVVTLLSHQLLASSSEISPPTNFTIHSAAMPIKTSLSCVAPPNWNIWVPEPYALLIAHLPLFL